MQVIQTCFVISGWLNWLGEKYYISKTYSHLLDWLHTFLIKLDRGVLNLALLRAKWILYLLLKGRMDGIMDINRHTTGKKKEKY